MAKQNRRTFLHQATAMATGAAIFPLLDSTRAQALLSAEADAQSASSQYRSSSAPAARHKMRGLMVDAARVPETLDYYRRVIEFCADWQLNALHFRLADDQGTALRFSSVPDLFTHANAFTPTQMSDLARFAASHGVDLIPELESFGHTGFITRSATYAHLLDAAPDGSSDFTGIIPVHPETLEIFGKLYREIAAIFPSAYLHGGCDEVNWGGSKLSQQALRARSRAQIWADYLNALNRLARGLHKEFIVWGDFVLHKEPQILAHLDKNVIVMDWNYWDTDAGKFRDALDQVRSNGSRAIGAPGLISYRWGARAGADQLRNIDAFAQVYLESGDPASMGVVLTNWVPSRYIQNSIWDGFAYAAIAFNEGSAIAQRSAFRRFVERHYGAQWSDIWNQAFQLIYDTAPGFGEHAPASTIPRMPIPWSTAAELQASIRNHGTQPNPFTHLRSLLASLEPSVRTNRADFQAFALCVEYLDAVFWRESVIRDKAQNGPLARNAADQLIRSIAERDRKLGAALSADWDSGRFPDSAAKLHPLFGMQPKDQLVFQWSRATDYSALLSQHPDQFFQLLKSSDIA